MNALEEADRKLPSDVPAYPSVVFSTGISWQQVADEYGEIVDRQIASADLRPLVTKLTAGKNARDDKASAILQYLSREIRYTGVEFGNATVVPRSPAETLTRKYGDCKDKASLLVAMLRSAGIPAYLALLKADGEEDVFPDLPGMGMFNHAIVFVPGPPDLWIDATDEYARIGQIPIQDQERLALFARTGSGTLVRTPATSSADNLLIEKREIFLAENGPARIVETSLPHGGAESFYRRNYGDKESKAAQEVLTKHVKSEYLAENLDRIDHSDSSDLSKQFELVLESNRAKRGFTDLNAAVAVIRFDDLFGRLPSELQQAEEQEDSKSAADNNKPRKKRTADWQLDDAFVTEWRYTIVPPAGFRVKPLPPNTKLLLGPAILTEEFAADKDGVVHATVRFDTVKRRMTVSEATEMRNQVALVRTGGPVVIYFEPVGQALLAEGKVQEALQSYHNLIALHPQESIYHLRLAETLLAAGMGETARAEAQAAVKLEPLSALAQRTLADVLEYDLVGRKFRAGSDYSGAEVAFRNAITLDLDDETARGNLAILLEYNHEGVRYGQGAKLKEAIDEYRAITQEKLASLGLANNLAVALFYAGQFADARKSAETLNPQPIALIVACEGALHGAQAAIAEAERRTESKERLREVLKNAGQTLLNLRKYSVAADLLEAGASGDNASQTVGLASALRKARPHEEIQLGNDPASTALQAFFTFTDSNLTLQKLNALYSRNAQLVLKREDPDEVANTLNAGRQLRPSLARSGLPLDVLLDIIVGMPKPAIEGSDDSGYRATLQIPGGKTITMFVVREDSKCKLLDSTDNPSAIGLEVLDRVNANNLDGARVLLDWLREAQHLEGGDDPLAGPAFPRFWTRGKAADAAQMKLAAAAILVQTKSTAALGVPILEAARSSATDEASKLNISLALAIGYRGLYDYQKQLAEASELAKQYPESKTVVFAEIYDLVALSRFDDAAKLAEARIQRMPGDVDAMRALALVAVAREDYTRAHELDQKVIDTGKAEASDFNVIAWHALYLGRIDPSDLEYALKATQLSQNNPSILHTLGCVYAEMGKTKEAREVLIQAMDQEGLDEPNPAFWYAFGRIAEQYGIREAAIADYARVTKPNQAIEIPDSSYRLAQLRLQAVRAANDRASASGKKE